MWLAVQHDRAGVVERAAELELGGRAQQGAKDRDNENRVLDDDLAGVGAAAGAVEGLEGGVAGQQIEGVDVTGDLQGGLGTGLDAAHGLGAAQQQAEHAGLRNDGVGSRRVDDGVVARAGHRASAPAQRILEKPVDAGHPVNVSHRLPPIVRRTFPSRPGPSALGWPECRPS